MNDGARLPTQSEGHPEPATRAFRSAYGQVAMGSDTATWWRDTLAEIEPVEDEDPPAVVLE